MNHTYRPSGKISVLFVPALAVMLLMAAAGTFACTFCIWFSPYTMIDAVIYIIFTRFMAKYGSLWCIKCGKVRNSALSVLTGLFLALWYWYLLLVLYRPVRKIFTEDSFILPKDSLCQAFQIFRPSEFQEAFTSLMNEGAAFTEKNGGSLFYITGTVCIVILSLVFLATAAYFAAAFQSRSRYPFCEASGRWAEEITLTSSVSADEELFLTKLLLGDTQVLSDLMPLHEVNVDHYQITLFVTGKKDNFYATVCKMNNSGKTDRHTGKIFFEETKLVKYLVIDRTTGLSLLSRRRDKQDETAFRVVTDQTEKRARRILVTAWICGILQFLILGISILRIKNAAGFLLKGGFFYTLVMFLTGIIQFIRSFRKETVIRSTEERLEYDSIKKHLGTETATPTGYKLYYLFLTVSALILFGLCMWRI